MQERDIFVEALQRETAAERAAYLHDACAADTDLRQRVERLLLAHESQKSFILDAPAVAAAVADAAGDPTGDDQLVSLDPPAFLTPPGTMIGRYKILEPLGEGGYGTVFMAEQTTPVHRKVALKIIKAGMDTRQVIARFEAERQALALMDHPNIAKVHDAGVTDAGRPYFVMELVKGTPITRYCDEHRLTPRARLELFVQVCHAVQHAHTKGIIHRDLKPTNVLVASYDGRPVPKVIDFGVAKATGHQLTERTMFTGLGDVIGTLEYMSPEQAELNQLDVDTRSDIYSLGVLLYELLTGSTPLENKRAKHAALLEMLRVVREEEPPRPSTRLRTAEELPSIAASRGLEPKKLSGLVHGELDWIVMKALEKDRGRRYETANGLAMDVQRYLGDEAVHACPPSPWYRFRKFARRNRRAVATAAAAALVVVLAVVGLATSTALIARALRAETEAKGKLDDTLKSQRVDAYFHRITLAHDALSKDDLGRALKLLGECPENLREWEWHYLMRLCRVEPLVLRDDTEVNGLAFSPDGQSIAAACGGGTVKIRNSKTGKVIQTLDAHPDAVFAVAYHPDGNHLATAGADGQAKVWDLRTREKVFDAPSSAFHNVGTAYGVALGPGDGRLLALGNDGAVEVWDWRSRQRLHSFAGHQKRAINVAFSGDGRLASGSGPGSVTLCDPESVRDPLRPFAKSGAVAALAFSPDGGRLATGSFGRRVEVWDSTTGELLHTLPHSGLVLGVAFSPDGRYIASTGEDKVVHVWDATTRREVLGLRGHDRQCGCVAFSPDGWRLASASTDGTIRVWDATPLQGHEGQETLTFTPHGDEVWSVALSPVDGQQIVSAGWGMRSAKVWDARTGKVSVPFNGHTGIVFCVTWQPDGQRIASAGQEDELLTVKVWDAQTGRQVFELPREPEEYFAAAFSPDGRYLVTGRAKGAVQVWDAQNGNKVGTLGTHDRQVRGVVFSHDGRHLASASDDGKVKLWDAKRLDDQPMDGKKEARLTLSAQNRGRGLTLAFSPDGRRLVTAGERHTAQIWDVETGQELKTLEGHSGDVCAVAFSPDDEGRWIASAGEDSTVKVWDSRTGASHTFRGHTGLVTSVTFAADGRRLVSGSRDHTVRVWDLTELIEVSGRQQVQPAEKVQSSQGSDR